MSANPGRNSHLPRAPLSWQASVGALIDAHASVHACCSKCGLWKPADLQAITARRGRDFSLWDAKAPCPTPGCTGHVFFHASPGAGTPSRPMRS